MLYTYLQLESERMPFETCHSAAVIITKQYLLSSHHQSLHEVSQGTQTQKW